MKRFIFLFSLIVFVSACPTKEQALDCFYKKADLNNDGRISRHELEKTIDKYLPWYKRWPFKTFGGISRIMRDCDSNYDHFLTKEEANVMSHTCLESCFKRSNTVSVFKCH